MKKTLVALTAVASACGAVAQSNSVTLYGVADAWVGQTRAKGTTVSQTRVQSGGLSTSRVGINVREDIGDGLKGFVGLEAGANIDDPAGSVVPRRAVIGLSGGFGSLSLGRQTTPYDDVYSKTYLTADSAFDGGKLVYGRKAYSHGNRYSNSIRYDTPNFDGLSAGIHLGLGEDKSTTSKATRNTSLNVRYANGPLAVVLGHQVDERSAAVKRTNTLLAGAYDFGSFKLNLGVNNGKETNKTKERAFNVGGAIPLGAFTLLAEYGETKLGNNKYRGYGVEGRYALSKRTTAYAGFGEAKQRNVANSTDRNIGIGVRHTF